MTSSVNGTTLVLGGARSGKSALAERLACETGLARHYIATGRAFDAEMRQRIDAHRSSRGPSWITHEEPVDLVGRLQALDDAGCVVLVDCLTLWLTNLMLEERDIAAETARLVACLPRRKASILFVSNEVGLGIVPDNAMARAFRDHAGRLHQQVAALARDVYFVAAGLPLKMKG